MQDAQGDEDFLVEVFDGGRDGKFFGQGRGNGREFGIGSGGIVDHVETESDHDAICGKALHENAANFFRSDEHIVRPAQPGLQQPDPAQGGDNSQSGGEGKGGPSALGRIERQHDRGPEPALARIPATAVASAGGSLPVRADSFPRSEVAREVIGRTEFRALVQFPTAPLARVHLRVHVSGEAWRDSNRRARPCR